MLAQNVGTGIINIKKSLSIHCHPGVGTTFASYPPLCRCNLTQLFANVSISPPPPPFHPTTILKMSVRSSHPQTPERRSEGSVVLLLVLLYPFLLLLILFIILLTGATAIVAVNFVVPQSLVIKGCTSLPLYRPIRPAFASPLSNPSSRRIQSLTNPYALANTRI